MKRIGVCVFYDDEGVSDNYFFFLLSSFDHIVDETYVIVNGKIRDSDKMILIDRGYKVVIRDNYGFDAFAFKHFFLDVISLQKLGQYDEIVLFNDTFYGPFYNWNIYFDAMSEDKCDFWGISSHSGGIFSEGVKYTYHIQSYFIVVKKRMFLSPFFYNYWKSLKFPSTRHEATLFFELTFTEYFLFNGFSCSTWLEKMGCKFDIGINPYNNKELLDLINTRKMPILKKKALALDKISILEELYCFLNMRQLYDISYIENNIKRLNRRIGRCKYFDFSEFNKFLKKFSNIYIFGNGVYGKSVLLFLVNNNISYKGIVVSKEDELKEDVIELKKFKPDKDTGVIVAVSDKYISEVIEQLLLIVKPHQLFY